MPTKIEWSDETWNPVTGCDKVSPGCAHCYAETIAERFRGVPGHPYEQGFDLKLHPERLGQPHKWRKPRRVFVNSMSDLFHPDIPPDFTRRVFATMAECDRHTFQVLTKRPEVARELAGYLWRGEWPANIWLGVSVENRAWTHRIDTLREIPAAVRFLSCEPLLGPLDFLDLAGIGWVIVGGETGPKARPMNAWWARAIRDQCSAAGVPFFFKQWGEWNAEAYRVGRQRAGRELDGVLHEAFPA